MGDLLWFAIAATGLAALAKTTFGVDLPANDGFAQQLGADIDRYTTVSP